jgi:hypothetical protein
VGALAVEGSRADSGAPVDRHAQRAPGGSGLVEAGKEHFLGEQEQRRGGGDGDQGTHDGIVNLGGGLATGMLGGSSVARVLVGTGAPSYKGFRFPAEIISHCV